MISGTDYSPCPNRSCGSHLIRLKRALSVSGLLSLASGSDIQIPEHKLVTRYVCGRCGCDRPPP